MPGEVPYGFTRECKVAPRLSADSSAALRREHGRWSRRTSTRWPVRRSCQC